MPWRMLVATLWLAACSSAAADEPHSYDGIRRLRRADFRTQHPFSSPGQPPLPKVHLFIGVPSVSAERRAAIRASWGRLAAGEHGVVLRFFTHRDEGAHPDEQEAESAAKLCADPTTCGDVVFIGDELLSGEALLPGQNGVTQKVYLLFEHAVTFFNPDFVMKADDDTFVNIPVVLAVLAAEHHSRSAIYFGRLARAPEVGGSEEEEDSPFASYLEDTLARSQLPVYAAGPGYALSGAAVQAIVAANNLVGLRHNFHEDIAVGLWLSGLLVRFVGNDMAGVDIVDSLEVGRDPDPEPERFCPGAEGLPFAWIHGLKHPGDMAHVLALAQPCMDTWEAAARTAAEHG